MWWPTDNSGDAEVERFLVDMDGNGLADAVVFDAKSGNWSVAPSTPHQHFGPVVTVDGDTFGCNVAGLVKQIASRGTLWCVTSTVIGRYDYARGSTSLHPVRLPSSTRILDAWVAQTTHDVQNEDVIMLDSARHVFVVPFVGTTPGAVRLAYANFTAPNGECSPAMAVPFSTAVLGSQRPPTAAVACANVVTGYWYAAPISQPYSSQSLSSPVVVWKYNHGGSMLGIKGPRPQGWGALGRTPYAYARFHVADPFGAGEPVPIACNLTSQGNAQTWSSPRCLVMPPDNSRFFFAHSGFLS